MNGETQANRLAQLMRKKGYIPSYELALPFVTVRSSSVEKLESGDIFLLGLNSLMCILINGDKVCANGVLIKQNNRLSIQITKVGEEPINKTNSKKYENIKLLFGTIYSRSLAVGHMIDIAEVILEKVIVVSEKKKIATASLINVDSEIAVKIEKVEV